MGDSTGIYREPEHGVITTRCTCLNLRFRGKSEKEVFLCVKVIIDNVNNVIEKREVLKYIYLFISIQTHTTIYIYVCVCTKRERGGEELRY